MSVLQAVDKRIPTEAQVAKGYLAKKSEDEKKKFTVIWTATYIHSMATRAYITKMVMEYITIEFFPVFTTYNFKFVHLLVT